MPKTKFANPVLTPEHVSAVNDEAIAIPMEFEPPHKRIARLAREQQRLTEALRNLKRTWADKNIKAQATHMPIATAEITHVERQRRELAGELLRVQGEIGAVNKAIRERKAGGGNGAGTDSTRPPAIVSKKTTKVRAKNCPLKEHAEWPAYFLLAAREELTSALYAQVERSAKALLSHALQTGIESP